MRPMLSKMRLNRPIILLQQSKVLKHVQTVRFSSTEPLKEEQQSSTFQLPLFPWKPLTQGKRNSFLERIQMWISFQFFDVTFQEFVAGARQTLTFSAQGLVDYTNNKLLQNRNKSVSPNGDETNSNVKLDELFEPRISLFYENSVKKLVATHPNAKIYYSFTQSSEDESYYHVDLQSFNATFMEEALLKRFHPKFYAEEKSNNKLEPMKLTEEEAKELGTVYEYRNIVFRIYTTFKGKGKNLHFRC